MAFINKNFTVIAYANGFTLWHYVTEDSKEQVCSDDYFNKAKYLLAQGDMILINASDGNCIRAILFDDGIVKLTNLN